jgi:chromosome segregation ATPase
MSNEGENKDLEKLHKEIKELKTKLRMTKSDRDMISKYTSQVNKDMSSLQDKYNNVLQERDYYISHLRDIKNSYTNEISRLQKDNEKLQKDYDTVMLEFTDTKLELRNISFEYDVLQVDFHNETERCNELQVQSRELKRKLRCMHNDINDNDRLSTKRMNRLVERVEIIEKDKQILMDQIHLYETDLELLNLLCFVCRSGVKSLECNQCHEKYCKKCSLQVDKCPFCRRDINTSASASSNSFPIQQIDNE